MPASDLATDTSKESLPSTLDAEAAPPYIGKFATSRVSVSKRPGLSTSSKPTQEIAPSIRRSKFTNWLVCPIREDLYLECQLLVLAFSTGMQDAVSYPDYLCFASNQTGNTIFLAIGVSGIAPSSSFSFSNIGIALSLFVIGVWIMGQLGNAMGPRRRFWLVLSSAMQTAMVFGAFVVQNMFTLRTSGPAAHAVLALLAFSSGGQVAMARGLKITEITTAMATAAYVDLMVDPDLYKKHNRSRNRRFAFLLALGGGSFAGAFLHKGVNSPMVLLTSAILKTVVTVAFSFNKEMDEPEQEKDGWLMLA